MGKKIAIGTITGFVALFVMGYVIFELILKNAMAGMYEAAGTCVNMIPGMVNIILATLVQAFLTTLILDKFNANTMVKGLVTAGWVTFLIALINAIWFLTAFPWYDTNGAILDVLANTVLGALGGAAIGFVLGKVK